MAECITKSIGYRNKHTISYAEYGDKNGFPILINHGMIASIRDGWLFDRLIRLGAHLVCVARPGYGESSPYEMHEIGEWADLVSVLIEELSLARFDVLGMSSGAPYSYALGYRFPDKVRNIYIFSGIPALYDEQILCHWPYPANRDARMPELQVLAHELFFSHLSKEDMEKNDIKDSMMYDCFGIAQDLRLRCIDWGFRLQDIRPRVYMQHSQEDTAVPFITALLTSKILPDCHLDRKEHGEHFSAETLDDFIKRVIAEHFSTGAVKPLTVV